MAVHYVVTENSRPKIIQNIQDLQEESEEEEDKKLKFPRMGSDNNEEINQN